MARLDKSKIEEHKREISRLKTKRVRGGLREAEKSELSWRERQVASHMRSRGQEEGGKVVQGAKDIKTGVGMMSNTERAELAASMLFSPVFDIEEFHNRGWEGISPGEYALAATGIIPGMAGAKGVQKLSKAGKAGRAARKTKVYKDTPAPTAPPAALREPGGSTFKAAGNEPRFADRPQTNTFRDVPATAPPPAPLRQRLDNPGATFADPGGTYASARGIAAPSGRKARKIANIQNKETIGALKGVRKSGGPLSIQQKAQLASAVQAVKAARGRKLKIAAAGAAGWYGVDKAIDHYYPEPEPEYRQLERFDPQRDF